MTSKEKTWTWREIPPGAVAENPGSSSEYLTGGWRSQRPIFTPDNCVRCGVCYIYCPDASIVMTPEGYPDILLDYCKGCGICARECYMATFGLSCFEMVDEEELR